MSLAPRLTVDLDAIAANWTALDARSAPDVETAAVVKADAYGLGAERVGPALARAGARSFFVALPTEGIALRRALDAAGHGGAAVYVLGGYLADDRAAFASARLRPVLNSVAQLQAWVAGPAGPAALQLDTGMNRLGIEASELAALGALPGCVALVMSHLACADAPDHPMNTAQHEAFVEMTTAIDRPLSLAATGGTLLDPAFHFAMTRPGIGLYGGLPFADATPVVPLDATVTLVRAVLPGVAVGYGATWTATHPARIATLSIGYADGLPRIAGNAAFGQAIATHDGRPLPYAGRVSMDLISIDVTACPDIVEGDRVQILSPEMPIDRVAEVCGTIGYEILTSLGARYQRHYIGG
ncbi:MAG: alanine racemase [Pseudomonadota bacterium]